MAECKKIRTLAAFSLYFLYKISVRLDFRSEAFKKVFDQFSITHLHSNHLNRLKLQLYQHFKFRTLLPKFVREIDAIDLEIMKTFCLSRQHSPHIKNKHFIFVGDSHTEFLSRIRISEDDLLYANSHAIWLGPVTLFGLDAAKERVQVTELLKAVNISDDCEEIYLLWSLGTIDIRASIYELSMRGVIDGEQDIGDLVHNSLNLLGERVMPDIQKFMNSRFGSSNIINCFIGASNSPIEGSSPQKISEIKSERKLRSFPTFGSVNVRRKYSDHVNVALRSWCNENSFIFYNPYPDETNAEGKGKMLDGFHLTDPKEIHEMAHAIIAKGNL